MSSNPTSPGSELPVEGEGAYLQRGDGVHQTETASGGAQGAYQTSREEGFRLKKIAVFDFKFVFLNSKEAKFFKMNLSAAAAGGRVA